MSTIPSVKQILIQYLWGQETMPSSTELVDPKWIRENNDVKIRAMRPKLFLVFILNCSFI